MSQISLHTTFYKLFCSFVILKNIFEEVSLNPDFFLNLSRRCKLLLKKKSCHKSHRQELKLKMARKANGLMILRVWRHRCLARASTQKKNQQGDLLNSLSLQRSNAYYYPHPELFWTYFNRLLWAITDVSKKKNNYIITELCHWK